MPLSATAFRAARRSPPVGAIINDRTSNRLIGTVWAGALPGSTHPQGVSGIRYAFLIQKPSNSLSSTVIYERCFTQYVAYQPGTIRRPGKPLSIGSGWPFI